MNITLDVEGVPAPQPRVRARIIAGHAGVYTPDKANGWKNAITLAALPVRPAEPMVGPLGVEIIFRMPRPKSHFRKNGDLRPNAPAFHTSGGRADIDNLAKSTFDALTDVGMWADDSQVCVIRMTKRYVLFGERPGARIHIQMV